MATPPEADPVEAATPAPEVHEHAPPPFAPFPGTPFWVPAPAAPPSGPAPGARLALGLASAAIAVAVCGVILAASTDERDPHLADLFGFGGFAVAAVLGLVAIVLGHRSRLVRHRDAGRTARRALGLAGLVMGYCLVGLLAFGLAAAGIGSLLGDAAASLPGSHVDDGPFYEHSVHLAPSGTYHHAISSYDFSGSRVNYTVDSTGAPVVVGFYNYTSLGIPARVANLPEGSGRHVVGSALMPGYSYLMTVTCQGPEACEVRIVLEEGREAAHCLGDAPDVASQELRDWHPAAEASTLQIRARSGAFAATDRGVPLGGNELYVGRYSAFVDLTAGPPDDSWYIELRLPVDCRHFDVGTYAVPGDRMARILIGHNGYTCSDATGAILVDEADLTRVTDSHLRVRFEAVCNGVPAFLGALAWDGKDGLAAPATATP